MTTTASTQTLDSLVARYTDLDARKTALEQEMADIKAQIRDQHDVGSYEASGLLVSIREPNRTFDLEAAAAVLPEPMRQSCQVVTYDARKVKSVLTLADIGVDEFYRPGNGPRIVTIK